MKIKSTSKINGSILNVHSNRIFILEFDKILTNNHNNDNLVQFQVG